jgi:hypothetical protein
MPRVFDNITDPLLPAIQQTLKLSQHADFCIGYLSLRGWSSVGLYIEDWPGGEGHSCRVLVGMQKLPEDELREFLGFARDRASIDN